MSASSYDFHFDEATSVLLISIDGFWTSDVARSFKISLLTEVMRHVRRAPVYRTLLDQTTFGVQSVETTEILNSAFEAARKFHKGRVAIVAGSVLSKLQVERNIADPNVRVFTDRSHAETWLRSDESSGTN